MKYDPMEKLTLAKRAFEIAIKTKDIATRRTLAHCATMLKEIAEDELNHIPDFVRVDTQLPSILQQQAE